MHPPQPKRVAPDLFFQRQVYRHDGGVVLLPPGRMTMTFGRGPEYRLIEPGDRRSPSGARRRIDVRLERWFDPEAFGFFGGDHHIHAAGCATTPTRRRGSRPEDVFLQVKGEGLNVGCVLTWGPCYDYPAPVLRAARPTALSEPRTVIKYDVEVSGFGSQALGHVCLLNLRDQTYPGSDGTATKGWPTWTSPVLRWAKAQGAVTGYAHSASGLEIDPKAAAGRLLAGHDEDEDGSLTAAEAAGALLPGDFAAIDADRDGVLTRAELEAGHERAAESLPNHAIPEMDGVGAMEIPVSVAEGLCDFISAMDTPRIAEWNMWYHLLNCGFPLKVSGETDFPCMSGTRVGQGRVYVRLGDVDSIDFDAWCEGLRLGRSYVSDGYAHAPEFTVGGKSPGDRLELERPATVPVRAKVAFASRTPLSVAHGGVVPAGGRRLVGDTVNLHGPRREGEFTARGRGPPRRAGGQRPGGRDAGSARRRPGPRAGVRRPDRAEQLGRPAPLPPDAHQPGGRPRGRPADPGLAPQRPVVHRGGRAALAQARADRSPRPSERRPAGPSTGPSRGIAGSRPRPPRINPWTWPRDGVQWLLSVADYEMALVRATTRSAEVGTGDAASSPGGAGVMRTMKRTDAPASGPGLADRLARSGPARAARPCGRARRGGGLAVLPREDRAGPRGGVLPVPLRRGGEGEGRTAARLAAGCSRGGTPAPRSSRERATRAC